MFPPEQATENQSALFAKKLLAVAISNITYLRAIFPEKAYGDRCLGGKVKKNYCLVILGDHSLMFILLVFDYILN